MALAMVAGASAEVNWKEFEGTKLQVMLNQHNYQKAVTDYGKLKSSKP